MLDFKAFRRIAIRYWERRRIIYNLLLIPPSFFAYMATAGLAYVGDPHDTLYGFVLFWFLMSAIGANVCYSLAYALEFLLGNDDPASTWLRFGRRSIFFSGAALSIILALVGGRNIALMEFYENAKRSAEKSRATKVLPSQIP